MKNILFLLIMTFGVVAIAQKPISFDDHNNVLPALSTHQTEVLDMEKVKIEDERHLEETGIEYIGRITYDNMNMQNCGTWITLADGSKLWRFQFQSSDAQGTCVYFDDYYIPEGGELYAYSLDRSFFVGPIGADENNDHGKYVTDLVPGEIAVLEYYQPADVIGEASLTITGFGYFYKGVHEAELQENKASDPCEVNVNCPEGDGWENERDAVVRLLVSQNGGLFFCSGALVNNTAQDCKQYLLTALHCVDGVSDADFLLLKIRFNYERAGCVEGSTMTSRNRTGAFHLADSNDNGGSNGSDFALLEVEDEISSNWDIYFAGWDAGTGSSSSGVSIHHPAGDRKKISTYTSSLLTATWQSAFGAHWRVVWAPTETNHGVTEGGSSGSPIFNPEHQIVGTLTGGSSFCDSPYSPDYYGKMSYHWTSNPNPSNEKLNVWLDPLNTGQTTMDGIAYEDCTSTDINEIQYNDVNIFPNPTTDRVTIEFLSKNINNIKVFNSLGVLVLDNEVSGSDYQLDVEHLPKGVYYLTFTSDNQHQLTKKITKL